MKKKNVLVVLMPFLLVLFLTACGGKSESLEDQLVGSWYAEGNNMPILSLHDDHTCAMYGESGVGTWTVENENQLKLTNDYDETDILTVISIENGCLTLGDESGTNSIQLWNTLKTVPSEDNTEDLNDSTPVENQYTSVELTEATSFSEGVAWVKFIDSSGNTQNGLLHTDGHITPVPAMDVALEEYGSSFSEYSGGYSWVNLHISDGRDELKSFIIFDENGDIVSKSPDDGCGYQIRCGGDGVYFVKKMVRSMTENEDLYGFISADGIWLHECSSLAQNGDNPLSAQTTEQYNGQWNTYTYESNGIFWATYSKIGMAVDTYKTVQRVRYNVYTDEITYYDGDGKSHNTLYREDMYREHNGITFTSEGIFYSNGVSIADLSQYKLKIIDRKGLYEFQDGYCAVVIEGADGNFYLGFIDMNGEFTFEPKRISYYNYSTSAEEPIGVFSDGVITCHMKDENDTMQSCILHINGNIDFLYNVDYIGNFEFHDGYAWDDINKCFIGTDGDILEVYAN